MWTDARLLLVEPHRDCISLLGSSTRECHKYQVHIDDGRNSPMQQATIDQLLRSSLLPCWQSTGVVVNRPGYHRQDPQLIHPIEVIGGNVCTLVPPVPCPGPMTVTNREKSDALLLSNVDQYADAFGS